MTNTTKTVNKGYFYNVILVFYRYCCKPLILILESNNTLAPKRKRTAYFCFTASAHVK